MEQTITYHTCSKCGEEKPLTSEYFYKRNTKFGWRRQCRSCINLHHREYCKNSNKIKEQKKCPSCNQIKSSNEFLSNTARWDNLSTYCKECDYENMRKGGKYYEYELKRSKKRQKTKEYKEYHIKYRNDEKTKERRRKLSPAYHKLKNETDPLYKTKRLIAKRLWNALKRKGWGKNTRTHNYLKCDWQTFKEYIENQFTEGMSWDNQGEWHLDHYYPVSLAQTEDDMYIFNHYTNFQPLWAEDNLSKSNKVPDGFEEWYESMKEKVYGS